MSRLLDERRLFPLLALVAFGVFSCGGKASSEAQSMASGGASGASSSGGTAGTQLPEAREPEPSLEATLPAMGDASLTPLMLRLTFDIAVRAGCH